MYQGQISDKQNFPIVSSKQGIILVLNEYILLASMNFKIIIKIKLLSLNHFIKLHIGSLWLKFYSCFSIWLAFGKWINTNTVFLPRVIFVLCCFLCGP